MRISRRLRLGAVGLCAAALAQLAGAVPLARAEEAWVVESEGYTLREAPKPGAKSVGSVKVGERVFVLGRAAGWVPVETGERRGWVTESGIGAEAPASLPPDQQKWSRVLQIDPLSPERLVQFAPGGSRFFDRVMGSCQRLPNGNTLIVHSEGGAAFELTRQGKPVWSYEGTEQRPDGHGSRSSGCGGFRWP